MIWGNPIRLNSYKGKCNRASVAPTLQNWIMKKFVKTGYPGLVLYHSQDGDKYHVHFVYPGQDVVPAVSEIMSHDRYQKKKYVELQNHH